MSTTNLTVAEQQLHSLMHKVSHLQKQRGICEWAEIDGRRVMCAPIFHADGRFKTWKFIVDGKLTKFDDMAAICRAAA
jgi:hypothetical protein